MENKKLINILLKDMGELQELISEVKDKGSFNPFEIEFLHTRANGIMQLLQMLNEFDTPKSVENEEPVKTEVIQEKVEIEVPTEEEKVEIEIQQESVAEVKIEKEEIQEKVEEKISEEIQPEPEPEIMAEEVSEVITEEIIEEEKASLESKEVELEEEKKIEANQRLGDSFLKGKSVNDLIDEQNKLEYKLSNRPVGNIQSAIGINDRFQYIRELFEGNTEKFKETISSLDGMNNINEAVYYLQQNFKWKKNETSLKFVNLVKRRFAND